ncbi:helicase associated domain-containing protein [Streptomyces sp. NPDC001795]|uniref:helicase associated domain-containing protein n=1 Tax=Streptomyces sp. NPDC001795 TaxID=3154525 RepID=UPI00332DF985
MSPALGFVAPTSTPQRCAPTSSTTTRCWRPAEWQLHYAAVGELLREETEPTVVLPGVTVYGLDIGRWLAKQREHTVWAGLMDGQREHLEQLGIVPLPPQQEAPAAARKGASGAFERGVAAHWRSTSPHRDCDGLPRTQVETVVVDGQEHSVRALAALIAPRLVP